MRSDKTLVSQAPKWVVTDGSPRVIYNARDEPLLMIKSTNHLLIRILLCQESQAKRRHAPACPTVHGLFSACSTHTPHCGSGMDVRDDKTAKGKNLWTKRQQQDVTRL